MLVIMVGRINTVTTGRSKTAARNGPVFRLWLSNCFANQNVPSLLCQRKNGEARSNEPVPRRLSAFIANIYSRISALFIRSAPTKVRTATDDIDAGDKSSLCFFESRCFVFLLATVYFTIRSQTSKFMTCLLARRKFAKLHFYEIINRKIFILWVGLIFLCSLISYLYFIIVIFVINRVRNNVSIRIRFIYGNSIELNTHGREILIWLKHSSVFALCEYWFCNAFISYCSPNHRKRYGIVRAIRRYALSGYI